MRPVILARSGLIGMVSMAFVIASAQIAPPAHAEPTPPAAVVVTPSAGIGPAADIDTEAVAEAAEQYSPGNPTDAAELADAAATQEAVPVKPTLTGMVAETDTGTVTINHDGQTTVAAEGMPSIGMSATGDAEAITIIDGTVVQTEIAPSTDVVTRATDNGIQMIAILEDHNAPNEIEFPLDLPAGAKLVPQEDGSVAVISEVELDQPLPGEEARIDAEIDSIIGSAALSDDLEELIDEQWVALESIAPAATQASVQTAHVATVAAPWAIDANGDNLSTHYEVSDKGIITQVIETDEHTAFPVTADPELWWWIGTALTCTVDLASFLFAGAKLLKAVTQIDKLIKKSATLTKIVQKLGGAKETLKAIYNLARGFIEGKIGKYLSSTKRLLLASLSSTMLNWIGDGLGIGSCVSIVRELL